MIFRLVYCSVIFDLWPLNNIVCFKQFSSSTRQSSSCRTNSVTYINIVHNSQKCILCVGRVFNLNLRTHVCLNLILWACEHWTCFYIVFSTMKVVWQVCTSAPLLHHSAPHRFGLRSLSFVLLSSACHFILSISRKMGDDRKKRSRSRSRDKKRKDRSVFWQPLWFSCFSMPMDFLL